MNGRAVGQWLDRLVALDGLDPRRDRVVVACSGGADSLALLALTRAAGFDAVAVYVDHGLRSGTGHDAEIVAAAAEVLGARTRVEKVEVDASANVEARARDARYAALERARVDTGAVAVLVGHTADDQAETVLLNFLRGSALDGLAGMAAVRGTIRRPLLALRRADTREICGRFAFAPVHDPMNDDVRHRRVWLRREVLPRLEAGATRDLVPVLVRQAATLRDAAAALDASVAGVAPPGVPIDARRVRALPDALARRAVRAWLGPPPASRRDVDAVLAVVRGDVRAAEVRGGARIERAANAVTLIGRDGALDPVESLAVALPGGCEHSRVTLDAWVETAPPVAWPDGRTTCVVDADVVGGSALVRAATAGDRFRPLGTDGTKTVFDALAERGVAASRRAQHLVLAADGNENAVLPAGVPWWVLGYRIDARARVTTHTRRFLWVTASPVGPRSEYDGNLANER